MKVNHVSRGVAASFLASLLFVCSSASAANFPNDYFEVRVPTSPSGLGAALSYSIHDNAHLLIEGESPFEGGWDLGAGMGFHAPLDSFTDLRGQILLRSLKGDDFDKDIGKFATELNFGFQTRIAPQFEVGGKIGHVTLENSDYGLFVVHGRFHSNQRVSVGAEWRINGRYDNQMNFSVRFPFKAP